MRWIAILFIPLALFAKPKGHHVEHGTALIKESGSTLEIQTSDRAILNWDEFSIAQGETTRFVQPNTNSAVLNRVTHGISHIDGLLEANGRVYLLNPKGMIVGPSGNIQAESFIASTLDFDSEDFFKNRELLFSGNSQGRIVNMGKIAAIGGDVFLLAKAVINTGDIQAKKGVVGIAAGEEILLKPSGNQRLFIARKSQEEKDEGGIENTGLIEATSAELRADGNAFRFAINQSGVIEASGMKEEGGRVFLVADGGTVSHSGSIAAPSGSVHVLGEQVGVHEEGRIDVSSDLGGGEVLLGGDFQGKNPDILNAEICVFMEGAEISADALLKGDGGKIVLWSDEATVMEGTLSARGGTHGGDGGFMEVSSAGNLVFNGFACGEAPLGQSGQLLLDPSTVFIENTNENSGVVFNSTTGVYTPTNRFVTIATVLGSAPLQNILQNGNVDVTVTTASSFPGADAITLISPLSWSSNNSLTLEGGLIAIITGPFENTGGGNMTLKAKDIFFTGPSPGITTNTGSITLDAERDICFQTNNPFAIESSTGKITIRTGRNFDMGSRVNLREDISIKTLGPFELDVGNDFNMIGTVTPNKTVIFDLGEGGQPASFTVGGDFLMKGGVADNNPVLIGRDGVSSGNLTFQVGENMTLAGGTGAGSIARIGSDQGTGNILAIVDKDIILKSGSAIRSQSGEVTLVVDNKEPESPEIGNGRFILDLGATLETSGSLRIFTAKRSQNSINTTINGQTFVPGPPFIDSNTEHWGEYFPDSFGGFPFTIFYKSGFSQNLFTNEEGRASGEMFQNLLTYDDFLFSLKCFLFGYDSACYDQLFHPKGMVSSFDVFGDGSRFMLRQKYRNYHTKYVDSF